MTQKMREECGYDLDGMDDAEKLKAILNLSCVIMSRASTPAMKEIAEGILSDLYVGQCLRPDLFIPGSKETTWLQEARKACPQWREL